MANKSYFTYKSPEDKFIKVSNSVVVKYDADVVGVFCKLVKLSAGKSLSIDFISKKIGINERKIRKIIVSLENEGYIVRKPIRNEKGHIICWNYCMYSEPVAKNQRSHAGRKDGNEETLPTQNPTCRDSYQLENGKDNILSNTKVLSNIEDSGINKEKRLSNDNQKSSEDLAFESYMKSHYPYLMKMDIPLTREQAKKLKETYGEDAILQLFEDMNNYKPLLKNCRDAYKTALNWCRRRNLPVIKED